MTDYDFSKISDVDLVAVAHEGKYNRVGRMHVIKELAERALLRPELLEQACAAISKNRQMMDFGPPG